MLWCVVRAPMADAWATPLELVEFESASQRLVSGALIPGDRIQGTLAKPDGAGPFPAVIGLHGCAGMHDTTRQRLADELVARGYVILLVDSYATRGIDHACTSSAFATFLRRRPDAYGALLFLARQAFVDPHRVAAVGFSAGAWVTLSVAEPNSFELFVPAGNLRFRAAAAFYPPCQQAVARPGIPTLIFIGALDDWTPAADCSKRIASWVMTGRRSSSSSIPARTMDSTTRTFSPARPCSVTGWNTTARQRTMHVAACTSFSIGTSSEGGANAIELVERNTGRVTHRAYRRRSVSKHGHRLRARGHPSTRPPPPCGLRRAAQDEVS